MSEENRRRVYDKLIAAGRIKDISEALIHEFGEVPDTSTSPPKDKKQAHAPGSKPKKEKK